MSRCETQNEHGDVCVLPSGHKPPHLFDGRVIQPTWTQDRNEAIRRLQVLSLTQSGDALRALDWAINHLVGLPEHWFAIDTPTREPHLCPHEHARVTCSDCGIDLRGAKTPADKGQHVHVWLPIEEACGPMVTHYCACGWAAYVPEKQ